jgi:hypothetical protein
MESTYIQIWAVKIIVEKDAVSNDYLVEWVKACDDTILDQTSRWTNRISFKSAPQERNSQGIARGLK